MANVQLLVNPAHNAVGRIVAEGAGARYYSIYKSGKRPVKQAHVIRNNTVFVNYGLSGKAYDIAKRLIDDFSPNNVIINPWRQINKFQWCEMAKEKGLPVPEFKHNLVKEDKVEDFIAKPYYSFGGRGITKSEENLNSPQHYHQRFIGKRRFEVRVSFFDWLPPEKWLYWKRINENKDAICWNRHQGGKFVWVKSPMDFDLYHRLRDDTLKLTKGGHLGFGAVDYLVVKGNKHWFLEINTIPGFSCTANRDRYIEAFKPLVESGGKEYM
jgi:glutathione synthase/RimK-type ligase-like ATP-grasp enzyme